MSLGLSQEAVGAQGFVSTPGWVKIERGARSPSDTLIEKLAEWLVKDGYVSKQEAKNLQEELLTLKYMADLSPFVRRLATEHYQKLKVDKPRID